jgi:hypothetical protein
MVTLKGEHKDFINEMLELLSDLPSGYESLQRRLESKYGIDEEMFYEIKSELKNIIKTEK